MLMNAYLYPKTQALIEAKRAQGVYPGAVYTFLAEGREETFCSGLAQVVPTREKMTPELLFDVASLTKVICTTTVLLRLWQKRELDWDAPLKMYLTEFKDERITLRHLLTHTADIKTWIPNRESLNAAQLRQAYLGMQSGADLGKVVKYTDAGTILLGFMLEQWYQKPAIEVFQQEVLEPLGMDQSLFLPPKILQPALVPTEELTDGTVLRGITHDPKARVLKEHAGNAGLFTNMRDLTRFAKMLLNRGQTAAGQFLEPEVFELLLKDQTPNRRGGRSLGWDLKQDAATLQPILFHTGYTGVFLLVDVLQQEALLFLSNRVHPKDDRASYLKERDEIVSTFLQEKAQRRHLML